MFDDKGISQKEKRAVMENDRKVRSTFFHHAQASADDDRQGRFAAAGKTTVVGANPGSVYPKMPEGNYWAKDECPPEPPLGYAIDDQPTTGEVFEVDSGRKDHLQHLLKEMRAREPKSNVVRAVPLLNNSSGGFDVLP